VIGRVGTNYWIQQRKNGDPLKRRQRRSASGQEPTFEIYDARLNPIREITYHRSDTVVKEYLVAGKDFLDQLFFTHTPYQAVVRLNRYSEDGTMVSPNVRLASFPSTMQADDFLLARSPDKSKILLLGFEPVKGAPPRLHVLLFNSNWKVLAKSLHNEGDLAQPFIQYDFTTYPLEPFENSPVKVADNGEWLMVAPARRSNTYWLCHYKDNTLVQHPIPQTQGPAVQSTSLDLKQGKAIAGFLLQTGASPFKKLHLLQFALPEGQLRLDTTYRFRTAAGAYPQDAYLSAQDLFPVEGRGFLLLKEYGRSYVRADIPEGETGKDGEAAAVNTVNDPVPLINKKDYTRFSGLYSAQKEVERGDLSLYYFPALPTDSCWSGLLNFAQATNLNAAYLSYVCLPVAGKILFLYNSVTYSGRKFSSTTILDEKGHALREGLVFWRSGNLLDFQKARQIGSRELVVPYQKNRLHGFAVIRL
jgi:hypothetical protein